MGNIATTVEEQIKKLKNRGLVLERDVSKGEDLKRVKENLLDIGYYRLGFYWFPFEKVCPNCKQHKNNHKFYKERNQNCLECNKHRFEDSSNFFNAIDLYYLDWDLKHSLIKYINRIEVNFRTTLIYTVSNQYKQSPNWFMDSKIMMPKFIDVLPKYYNKNFKQNNKVIDYIMKNI